MVAEYALNNVKSSICVSEYKLKEILLEKFKFSLPSIKEIENELEHKGAGM
jgi:hypothetical protein